MPLQSLTELKALKEKKQDRKSVIASLKISKAHSEDIRLHTEAEVAETTSNPAYSRFIRRVNGYLVEQKFKVFKKYHRFPMSTTATCSAILTQLNKLFDGKNAIRSANYLTDRVEQDFAQYLKESKFAANWRKESLQALATSVNSILILDMPQDSPDPYFYFLPIEDVVDLDIDRQGALKWVEFWEDEETLAHISNDGWQLLKTDGGSADKILSIEFEKENTSGVDICRLWWTENVRTKNKVLKKSPFTEWISKLDWLEIWSTWKRMLDAYGSNPVTWSIDEDCSWEDPQRGVHCDGGYLKDNKTNQYVRGQSSSIENGYSLCPNCSNKRFVGAGSHMDIPPPKEGEDMRAPFGVVPIDKSALDNAREEEGRLREEIMKGITGGIGEPMAKEAINEKQVAALFEGWTNVLRQLKKPFEEAEAWILEGMAALRYGSPVLDMAINYGNEFYLMNENEALSFYVAAREVQLPDYILDILLGEYYKTKFRFDKKGFERMKVLMNVEPLKHITKAKAVEMADKGLLNETDLKLKMDFGSYVQRFERENGSVADFGVNMDTGVGRDTFAARVAKIKEVMITYIPETTPAVPPQPPATN